MRAGESRDGVEQDDDILARLDQTLGFFDDHVGHLHVTFGRFVERRADDLGLRTAGDHVGHFFRPLVDEQDDQRDLGMILDDRVGHLLHENRLATFGRRDDERALAFAKRRDEIADAGGDFAILPFEVDSLVRILCGQVVEGAAQFRLLGVTTVNALHLEECEIPFPFFGRTDFPHHRVTGAEIESLHLRRRHVDVVGPVQVIEVLGAQKAVAFRERFQDPLTVQRLFGVEQGLLDTKDQLLLAQS